MTEGYLYISRKLQENWLWNAEPFTKGQAWVDLVMLANYEQGSILVRGVKIDINRGEVGRSEGTLCQRWTWSKSKLRGFLTMLENDQQIIRHKSNIINKIEIVNYDLYQKPTNKPTNKPTENRLKKDTNKENKENKEDNICEFDRFWKEYPRKTDKAKAKQKYNTALKKDSLENIMAGLARYKKHIADSGIDQQYIKHAKTWLEGECWADELITPKQKIRYVGL